MNVLLKEFTAAGMFLVGCHVGCSRPSAIHGYYKDGIALKLDTARDRHLFFSGEISAN